MKQKRLRAPKAKPGELKLQWGKFKHDNPDICLVWGDGVPHCDVSLLHSVISCPICVPDFERTEGYQFRFDPTFIQELVKRGYDITTLKFSIMKKKIEDK